MCLRLSSSIITRTNRFVSSYTYPIVKMVKINALYVALALVAPGLTAPGM